MKIFSTETSRGDTQIIQAKISRKMDDTGHSVVYIINILLPEGKSRQPIITTNGNKKIITVPWLFDPKTGDYNTEIVSELKGYE